VGQPRKRVGRNNDVGYTAYYEDASDLSRAVQAHHEHGELSSTQSHVARDAYGSLSMAAHMTTAHREQTSADSDSPALPDIEPEQRNV
jgi:hypothetical protein